MNKRVEMPSKCYGGYIFDLDGTLVDSMELHYKAWREALAANGAPYEVFLAEEFVSYGGCAATDIVAALNKRYDLKMSSRAVATQKREIYMRLLDSGSLSPIDEVIELVLSLQLKGIPYAIGTGSALPGALATLNSAGLDGNFPIIVTPEDVGPRRGKPEPDIFLSCALRMGVAPENCIVFEDAQPGVVAAVAAGMDVAIVKAPDMIHWES